MNQRHIHEGINLCKDIGSPLTRYEGELPLTPSLILLLVSPHPAPLTSPPKAAIREEEPHKPSSAKKEICSCMIGAPQPRAIFAALCIGRQAVSFSPTLRMLLYLSGERPHHIAPHITPYITPLHPIRENILAKRNVVRCVA